MKARQIDITEWTRFGEGGFGESYNHVSNPDIMLKLYIASRPQELAVQEYERAAAVCAMGITTPEPLELVECEGRSGIIFERLKAKKSFSRLVADDPQHLEEHIAEFARAAREFHSTPCNKNIFSPQKDLIYRAIEECAIMPVAHKAAFLKAVSELPDADTCLHGDFHIGNAVRSEGRTYFIDLGDFAYGDPRLDIAEFKLPVFLMNDARSQEVFHMSKNLLGLCWKTFLKHYYGTESEKQTEAIDRSLNLFLAIDIAFMATKVSSTDYLSSIAFKLLTATTDNDS